MRVAIDRAGRMVIPKALREELGVTAGGELDVELVDGHLEARVPSRVRVEERDGRRVFVTDEDVPPLTVEAVRELVERSRR